MTLIAFDLNTYKTALLLTVIVVIGSLTFSHAVPLNGSNTQAGLPMPALRSVEQQATQAMVPAFVSNSGLLEKKLPAHMGKFQPTVSNKPSKRPVTPHHTPWKEMQPYRDGGEVLFN
jgi:hypothetical protein